MRRLRLGLLALICAAACGDVKPVFVDAPGGDDANAGDDAAIDAPIDGVGMATITLLKTGNGTVTSNPGTVNCGPICTTTVPVGTAITLTAAPDVGNVFGSWGGACNGSVNICSFTVTSDVTVNAGFSVAMFTLTVAQGGNGTGTVTSAPAGINCPGTCTMTVAYNTPVTLTGTATGSSQFLGWSGAAGCTTTAPCVVTVTADTTVNASFGLNYTVVVTRTGTGQASGSVTSLPIGINCGTDCNEAYSAGAMVTLTESVGPDATFSGWGGACTSFGMNAQCTLTVNAALSASASFTLRTFTLGAATNGTGAGTISSVPAGITCGNGNTACSATYNYGQMVTLTAMPTGTSSFAGWSGGSCSGLTNPCTITMDQARTVTATFNINTYMLSVAKGGTGAAAGTVTSNPGTISCGATCMNTFNSGTMVSLTATPGTGNTFTSWSGAPGCTTVSPCSVTMDQARNVTATFTLLQFTVTVAKAGPQASLGTITSSPGTINCGTLCSNTFDYGTVVTLSTTTGANTVFGGWTGGSCGAISPCMHTVTAAVTITGTFNVGAYDTTINSAPPLSTTSTTATFSFDSSPTGAGVFTCAIDESPFVACSSPITYSGLASTYHRFRVATAGATPDPTPASYSWMINGGTAPRLPDSFSAYCTDGVMTTTTCPAGAAGQDGAYRTNVPTYTTTVDTITDALTGLMWQRVLATTADNATATTYCQNLVLAGFSDWRLPTRFEVGTVMDIQKVLPPMPSVFQGIPQNSQIRTSTRLVGQPTLSWSLGTNYGIWGAIADSSAQPVLCVRGSTGGGTLISYSANTILDGRTGLMWQSGTNAAATWGTSLSTCENLTLDGMSDWRLPSQKELASVVDDNATNPAISTLFSSRPTSTFWTSSPNPNSTTDAYAIAFTSGGNANISNPYASLFASRCVRIF